MTRVGVCLPQLGQGISRSLLRTFCQTAEVAGFSSLWVQEHLFAPVHPRSGYAGLHGDIPTGYRATFAATELLAAAAAWTTHVRLGTSVLVAGYHRPVELAQSLATLDALSEGRLVVGLGLGWSADEHDQMDVPFDRRGARFEELVRALRACWSPDPIAFEGEFFSIPAAYVGPKPVQRPHPPLIAGVWGPQGRERTARLFDGWSPVGDVAQSRKHVAVMNSARDRAPLSVWQRVYLQQPPNGQLSYSGVMDQVAEAADAGFDEVIVDANLSDAVGSAQGWLETLDRLRPAIEIGTANHG